MSSRRLGSNQNSAQIEEGQQSVSTDVIVDLALYFGFVPIAVSGKVPLLPKWQSASDETHLKNINSRKGRCNIGILTGKRSGIVVVDVDDRDGGLQNWNQLCEQYGEPRTMIVDTGGGGKHYYFAYDPKIRNGNNCILNSGIDVRSDGGQVVFMGSLHPVTGKVYTLDPWSFVDATGTGEENDIVIEPIPEWLFNLLPKVEEQDS